MYIRLMHVVFMILFILPCNVHLRVISCTLEKVSEIVHFNLMCRSWDRGRKLEHQEKTHTENMQIPFIRTVLTQHPVIQNEHSRKTCVCARMLLFHT